MVSKTLAAYLDRLDVEFEVLPQGMLQHFDELVVLVLDHRNFPVRVP